MKKFIFLFWIIFITEGNANLVGRGELKLSSNVVNHFMHYLRYPGQEPNAFYVTEDGTKATHWICENGRCRPHNVGQGVRHCETLHNKPCKLFARKRIVKWNNGTNPGKGENSKYSGKWADAKIRKKLEENGFIGDSIIKKQPKIKKKTSNNSNVLSDEDIKQLKQLKELFDDGILTEEEFKKAKKKILN
jgi:hypothetical protein